MAFSHLWYLPTAFLTSSDDVKICLLIGASLDFMLFIPLTICFMLVLLQDRRRPLWPAPLLMAVANQQHFSIQAQPQTYHHRGQLLKQ